MSVFVMVMTEGDTVPVGLGFASAISDSRRNLCHL
jgi:hypothetical protein